MRILLLLIPLASLGACTMGPDYAGPASARAPQPSASFVRASPEARSDEPAVAAWWTVFGDPVLDGLQQRALAANPNVAIAQASLRQARSALRLEKANSAPNANLQAIYAHASLPGVDLGTSDESSGGSGQGGSGSGSDALNFYNLGFDASWEVDLWGGRRRSVEAARAQLEAAEASVADAQVSLTAEVGQAYANFRDRQQRIRLAQEAVARQGDLVALVRQRRERGAASDLDVEQQADQLEQLEAALLPLQAERDAYLNALAVLVGEVPGSLDQLLATPAAIPLPPAGTSIGDPASLLRRRPDVRAAERQYAAATAKIGVAEAARFPSVSFAGVLGIGGTKPGDVVDIDKLATIALPRLSWNILDFGRNAARVEQAKGGQDEAAARYRGVVLKALQDSEDALSRYGARLRASASVRRSLASARRVEALSRQRFEAGTGTKIQLLQSERTRLSAEQSLSQADAALAADYAGLQKALGLGWR
ncbi:efflux transporter outer membrane subunit [Rhizorhabdus phycosphaerae]|uniref:efflux transporter outer membrane subunit n=1 Tax=Rhizorhabdus phycosphaerae TaxID=2711156 RepID=UPI0013EE2655|nr:efflux transporter outer membrane subunit [Rhizorhabdus phycosphaerae]